jgi:hypothetical protein
VFRLIFPAAILFLLLPVSSSPAQTPDLTQVVTLTGLPGEWVLEEPVKQYSPGDLFDYIDGEAELYLPYGFSGLASAFYKKAGSEPPVGLSVDVYRMGSLLDAFGIYAQYRKPENTILGLGGEGFINPAQLMFYQDRYFIHLSASGTSEMDRSVLETLARAVSRKLPHPAPAVPGELKLVKVPSLIPRTERYYPEGLLGYRFFRHGLIALARLENKKARFFALQENSADAAEAAVDQYLRYLKESGKAARSLESLSGAKLLFALDPLHKGLILGKKGRYVFGVADLDRPAEGMGLIRELLANLP